MNNGNLIPLSQRNPEEKRAIARMGGVASGVARREKRKTIDTLEMFLRSKVKKGGKTMTRETAYFLSVFKKAIKTGNTDLLELIAKLRGEMVTKVDAEISANMPTVLTDEVTDDVIDTTANQTVDMAISDSAEIPLTDEVACLIEDMGRKEKEMRERMKKARETRLENIRKRKEMIAKGETQPEPKKKRKRKTMSKR